MRCALPIALAAVLAACVAAPSSPVPPGGPTTLPSRHLFGIGDPTRGAILEAAFAFGRPRALHGRPEAAARAVAALEHIAATVPVDQLYRPFHPLVFEELPSGRDEVRRLLGIAPAAPPQAVIDAFSAAAEALREGDRTRALAALPPAVVPDPAATLARLAALPEAPTAALATARAQSELLALDRQDEDGTIRRLRFGG
jgi:hypothetical protein